MFPGRIYDTPSQSNPLLAGGMNWNGLEYVDFLRALYTASILNADLIAAAHSDQIAGQDVVNSPALDGFNEDWHYGFGVWFECHSNTFDCSARTRMSSTGRYGAYPFIDYEHQYFGIVSREGENGSFTEGYKMFVSVEPLIHAWLESVK